MMLCRVWHGGVMVKGGPLITAVRVIYRGNFRCSTFFEADRDGAWIKLNFAGPPPQVEMGAVTYWEKNRVLRGAYLTPQDELSSFIFFSPAYSIILSTETCTQLRALGQAVYSVTLECFRGLRALLNSDATLLPRLKPVTFWWQAHWPNLLSYTSCFKTLLPWC